VDRSRSGGGLEF